MNLKRTVLVVEDEPLIREIISEFLTEFGFLVRCAESGREARMQLSGSGPIDAALVDIDLERRGEGFAVAREAHALWPEMLIVYVSGGSQARFADERVEGSLFFPKPYLPTRLCALLRDRIGREAA